MAFIPYSNDKNEQSAITVDKYGRLCLSAGLRRKLGCENEEIELILFFEEETRRIGIAKEYPGKYKPFKFDKGHGYSESKAKDFLHDNGIEYRDGSVRYHYDGTYNGVMVFKASREYIVTNLTFKQEKNGNLVRER